MSKYLELFKSAFDDSIGTKTKPENKPYIGYSLTEGKLAYTVVPEPVTGPADNEIWYITSDGLKVDLATGVDGIILFEDQLNNELVSHTYDSIGKIKFQNKLTYLSGTEVPYATSYFSRYPSTIIEIILPKTLETIDSWAFLNMDNLSKLTLPVSLKNITTNPSIMRESPFKGCSNLTSLIYPGTKEQWNNISKTDGWNWDNTITTIHCTDGDITL